MRTSEKALVIGANGFIGSHVVDSLVESGYDVRAFDAFKSSDTRFNHDDAIELFSGNFLNQTDLKEALQGVRYVFHLVSTTNPASAEADPLIDIETNVKGSVELFQRCVEEGVDRVIYSSSGGTVYGENISERPISENDPLLPVSPYGIGKVAIENYLRYFRVKHGLNSTIFRIANPYGERQPLLRKQGVIPIFIEKVLHDEPLTVMGDGTMVRDYIYVRDVADMMVESLQGEPEHDVYNLGSGTGHTLNEIVETIKGVSDEEVKVSHIETPATFLHTSVLDNSRFMNEFGYTLSVSLEDGIRKTYEYQKAQQKEE